MARRYIESKLRKLDFEHLGTPTDVKVLKEVTFHKTFNGVYSLRFNCDGELLAVGFGTGGIQIYKSSTGHLIKEIRPCRQGGDPIMALSFHPKEDHILYAASTDGHIYIFNYDTEQQVGVVEEKGNEINTFDFAFDGFNFATGGRDLGIRVYETKNNKLIQHYKGPTRDGPLNKDTVNNTMRVFALKYHPENEYVFITGGWDNQLKIWDTRANDGIKRSIMGPHICGDSIDMKNNVILAGQWTSLRGLQEINYTDGKVVKELNFPSKEGAFIYSAQYCNDDLVVAGGSKTNRAELIQISTNKPVAGFHLGAPIQAIDTTKNGALIAIGGATNKLYILQVTDK